MVDRSRRVLVVGGGIAGLATARALAERGMECEVVERIPAWGHPGMGLFLTGNSVRALTALGVGTQLHDRARAIGQQRFLDQAGRPLFEVDLRSFWAPAAPCLAIGRADLHEILRASIDVRLGRTVVALHRAGPRAAAVFGDGTAEEYDLVVGADGIRSWVRGTALRGAGPRFTGQISWRFVVDSVLEIDAWTAWLGHGRTFLAVPLRGGAVYCYADVGADVPDDRTRGDAAALCALYDGFAVPVRDLLAAARDAAVARHFAPIEEVPDQPWVEGAVVLVGDAAHGMSPNMAQGAGLAAEDALVLAETLAADLALEAYETRRRPRVTFVRAQTHRRDRIRVLPPPLRDTALRIAGPRIYRHDYARLLAQP
jgi:2-polyprenyl-6-methoxyphenol hydroxylase-like FAD-dependent oxidoreductase